MIYSAIDHQKLRQAGRLAAQALEDVCSLIKTGATGIDLDNRFKRFVSMHGARAACLGFHGYPAHLCVSVNEQICHGIPNAKPFAPGDVVSVDLVVELNGYYGDCCKTVALEPVSDNVSQLVQVTYDAMMLAINQIKPGMFFSDIGRIIQSYVDPYCFGIIKEYCGHGIGKQLHHDPQIVHYLELNQPHIEIQPGMCFTIEPMICLANPSNKVLRDGWTVVTRDKSTCAQFEHTVFALEDRLEILTIAP